MALKFTAYLNRFYSIIFSIWDTRDRFEGIFMLYYGMFGLSKPRVRKRFRVRELPELVELLQRTRNHRITVARHAVYLLEQRAWLASMIPPRTSRAYDRTRDGYTPWHQYARTNLTTPGPATTGVRYYGQNDLLWLRFLRQSI